MTKYIKYQLARRRKRRFTLRDNSPSAIEAARVIKHALLYRPRGAHSDRGPVEITPEDDAVWSLNEEKVILKLKKCKNIKTTRIFFYFLFYFIFFFFFFFLHRIFIKRLSQINAALV